MILIALGIAGMWYTGSLYFLQGEEPSSRIENAPAGWPAGGEGGGSGTGGQNSQIPETPVEVFPTDIGESAKFLVAFLVLGIVVGTGLGLLTAKLSLYRSEARVRVQRARKGLQREILEYIRNRPAFTVEELAEELRVPPQRVMRHIRRLLKRGLIRRVGREGRTDLYAYTGPAQP